MYSLPQRISEIYNQYPAQILRRSKQRVQPHSKRFHYPFHTVIRQFKHQAAFHNTSPLSGCSDKTASHFEVWQIGPHQCLRQKTACRSWYPYLSENPANNILYLCLAYCAKPRQCQYLILHPTSLQQRPIQNNDTRLIVKDIYHTPGNLPQAIYFHYSPSLLSSSVYQMRIRFTTEITKFEELYLWVRQHFIGILLGSPNRDPIYHVKALFNWFCRLSVHLNLLFYWFWY